MTAEFRPLSFEHFLESQAASLKRIANKTRGSHDADDLRAEAWLVAIEIGKRAGAAIDLGHPANQDTVLAWLYKRFVAYVDGKLKQSIDQIDGDSMPWHERLAAPREVEPLAQLIRADEEATELPAKGFSQFTAYMVLLKRCELSLAKLATYLDITFPTLQRRVETVSAHADVQPSMFDGVETVPKEFEPRSQIVRRLVAEHGLCPFPAWALRTAESVINIGRQLRLWPLVTTGMGQAANADQQGSPP